MEGLKFCNRAIVGKVRESCRIGIMGEMEPAVPMRPRALAIVTAHQSINQELRSHWQRHRVRIHAHGGYYTRARGRKRRWQQISIAIVSFVTSR